MSGLSGIIEETQAKFSKLTISSGDASLNEVHRSAKTGTLEASVLASLIDHTLLKADATEAEITRLCDEARHHSFASVCVNPSRVALARRLLDGSIPYPIAVVGFPLGATTTRAKVFETADALALGAREIDMVLAIGALKDRNYDLVFKDIQTVVRTADGTAVKVILETALLSIEEKVAACVIAREAGAQFVKTSTGFAGGGATESDVRLMRAVVGTAMKVKASGGIRSQADALRMIAAGADRIGASASVGIVQSDGTTGEGY